MIRPSGVGVGKPPVNGVKSWPRSEEPPRGDWLLLLSRLPDERGEDAVADFGVATEYLQGVENSDRGIDEGRQNRRCVLRRRPDYGATKDEAGGLKHSASVPPSMRSSALE